MPATSTGIAPSKKMARRVFILMGHDVKNHIDAERIGDLFREMFKIVMVVSLPFPAVAVVGVMRGKNHQSAFVVKNGAMMRYASAFLRNVSIGVILLATSTLHVRTHVL